MKKLILAIVGISTLAMSLQAMSSYEEFKMKKQSHMKKEFKKMSASGSLEEVKQKYLSKIESKKSTAPAMMKSKISGIESCIKSASSIPAVENCVPSTMK